MAALPTLTRNELAAIFKNEKIVRAFEALLDGLSGTPDDIATIIAGLTEVRALAEASALGSFQRPVSAGIPANEVARQSVVLAGSFLPRQTPTNPIDPLQNVLMNRCFGSR